ncbi:hypothetical protein SCB71_01940 [Herbiconiux sp. KACC 21604]|uniref:hypothetical protein n=1 Tax=unclassified Herbiconiux TaxID=2618217 RepID=UPI00149125F1|nr:hypothetical protein [Herbiconiux sp. SALV-R1]QJU55811.1 hypothetical protein HL652_20800 [Herbiconiux sp. SALV-R1]WPO87025.1 hypothetical protein SCB71_01940 [Herbiconiux sp. KACC 21604]
MDAAESVVIAGHVCVDEIVTAGGTRRMPGSPAVFMAPVLRDGGYIARVAAPHGPDFEALGAGLRMLEPADRAGTLVYVNDLTGIRRTQAVRQPEAAALGLPGPLVTPALAEARALLFTPLLPDPAPEVVAAYTAALPDEALRLVLLQGYLRELDAETDARGGHAVHERRFVEAPQLLPLFDVAVLSDEDLLDGAHASASAWAAAHPTTAVIVTRGAEGASVYRGRERTDLPAYDVGNLAPDALVGAGDQFGAELTLALLDSPAGPRAAARDPRGLVTAVARATRTTALRLADRTTSTAGASGVSSRSGEATPDRTDVMPSGAARR